MQIEFIDSNYERDLMSVILFPSRLIRRLHNEIVASRGKFNFLKDLSLTIKLSPTLEQEFT